VTEAAPRPPAQSSNSALKIVAIGCAVVVVAGVIATVIAIWYAKRKVEQFADNPGYATLRLAVAANPELETVDADAAKGTITVRNRKDGKTLTLNVDSVKDGKLVIEADGSRVEVSGGPGGGQLVVNGPDGESLVAKGGPSGGSIVAVGPNGQQVRIEGAGGKVTVEDERGRVEVDEAAGGGVVVRAPGQIAHIGGGADGPAAPAWLPRYPGSVAADGAAMVEQTGGQTTGTFGFTTADPVAKVHAFLVDALTKDGFTIDMQSQVEGMATVGASKEGGKRKVTAITTSDGDKTSIVFNFEDRK